MMKTKAWLKKCLCYVLMLAMILSAGWPTGVAMAADNVLGVSFTQVDDDLVQASLLPQADDAVVLASGDEYDPGELVRVSIVLEDAATIQAGYSINAVAENVRAMSYRQKLKAEQNQIKRAIEAALGDDLKVKWNLTLAANLMSAEVEVGQIDTIRAVDGVKDVVIEQQYQPMATAQTDDVARPQMTISTGMTGMQNAWQKGYTGAGSRVAIIDTGIDVDHQSFNGAALEYALAKNAAAKGVDEAEYLAGLNLLDAAKVDAVSSELNVTAINNQANGTNMYHSSKLPFAFNYVDQSYEYVDHNKDSQTDHGSHVAGIAAANRYIEKDGAMADAIDTVMVAGQAPDAQLLVMKVFGMNGGAYDSDYMAAIEDAIVLGADSINLSLGSSANGFSTAGVYQQIMESLTDAGAVVCMAAGNDGNFAENAYTAKSTGGSGLLYTDDVMYSHMGSPSSFTNSMSVASVDNQGIISDSFLSFGQGDDLFTVGYSETLYNDMKSMRSLDTAAEGGTEYEFVLVPGLGYREDYDGIDVSGKIAFVSRGDTPFYEKATIAVEQGAIATVIYNNVGGSMGMDMTDYHEAAPAVSITKDDAEKIKAMADELVSDIDEIYYGGKMRVNGTLSLIAGDKNSYTMSSFSSWGSTGDLALKPEITAPGGSIYSVNGSQTAPDGYKINSGTSMATPQVAGIAAAIGQYIREHKLTEKFGHSARQIAQSLLMATAIPLKDDNGNYYPLLQQGAGLANGENAINAGAYILMSEGASPSWQDGKVKAELGDDPERTGVYEFGFTLYNTENIAKTYQLAAELFTQAVAEYPSAPGLTTTAEYALKTTTPLDSSATFTANGTNIGSTLAVPANGSVTVQAKVSVTPKGKAWLEEHYQKGTYIQGFVFARPLANADGAISGSTLHIPLFAFYGNWTDPAMYDAVNWQNGSSTGTYSTPFISDASRTSYAVNYDVNSPLNTGSAGETSYIGTNHLVMNNANGVAYILGGNPLVKDAVYLPERNAVSSQSTAAQWEFLPLRDSVVKKAQIKNLTANTVLQENTIESADLGVWYSKNDGYWQGGVNTMPLNQSLAAVNEGEQIEFSFVRLPEYYAAGKMGENSPVGTGALLSITAVVDETNPQTQDITYNSNDNTLTVKAADENYIAAVALYSRDGQRVIAYTGADETLTKGQAGNFVIALPNKIDGEYLLQVYDYAMNTATYRIALSDTAISYTGAMLAYDMTDKAWVQVDEQSARLGTIAKTHSYTAATAVGSTVYAIAYGTELYALDIYQPQNSTLLGDTNINIVDMAYNAQDGSLYGVSDNSKLVKINMTTGKAIEIGTLPINTNTLACDTKGNFYSNLYGTGKVYTYTLDALAAGDAAYDLNGDGAVNMADVQAMLDNITGKKVSAAAIDINGDGLTDTYDAYLLLGKLPGTVKLVADTGIVSKYMQAMEADPNDDTLYWASYSTQPVNSTEIGFAYMFKINTATGKYVNCGDLDNQLSSLVILDKHAGSGYAPLYDLADIAKAETAVADLGSKTYLNSMAEAAALAVNIGVDNSLKDDAPKTVTVSITAGQNITNALYRLSYGDDMQFVSAASPADVVSIKADNSTLCLAAASVNGVAAGEAIATLTFSTKACAGDVELARLEENTAHTDITEALISDSHTWGSWQVTKAATCVVDGVKTRTCELCGKAQTEAMARETTAHSWGDWQTAVVATPTGPGEKYRVCEECDRQQTGYILPDTMSAAEQDSAFNRVWARKLTLNYALITGAGVNKVEALTAENDTTMRYLVTLAAATGADAQFHIHMDPIELVASGFGSALKANKVDRVTWDDNDTEYDVVLSNGLACLTVYCYANETECTPVEIYFAIGDEGENIGSLSTADVPGFGINHLEIWETSGVNKVYYISNDDETENECYIWLDTATLDNAVMQINPVPDSAAATTVSSPLWSSGQKLGENGIQLALKNGTANVTVSVDINSWGNVTHRNYNLHFSNHANQPPTVQNAAGKARVTLGNAFSLNLDTVFADPDGDTLSYTYTVNGGEAMAAAADFSFVPQATGDYVLVFTADDGQTAGNSTYTLTLTVVDTVIGDVNSDGAVNAKDAAVLKRYIAKWANLTIDLTAADVNADGDINGKDTATLKRYIAKWAGVNLG